MDLKNVLLYLLFVYLMGNASLVYSMEDNDTKQLSVLDRSYLRACETGELQLVKAFIERGANKDAYKNDKGYGGCHLAAQRGHLDVVKYLIEQQQVTQAFLNDLTAFHVAAQYNQLDVVKWYIQEKIDINISTKNGYTPLHLAVLWNATDVVRFLVELKNIIINIKNSDGLLPLHYAIERGNLKIFQLLLERGEDWHAKDKDGSTFLHYAIKYNEAHIVKFLVDSEKMDLEARTTTRHKYTPLHAAAYMGSVDIGRLLIQKGVDIHAKNGLGENAFVVACAYEKIDFAKMLLPRIDVNEYFGEHRKITPLYAAARWKKLKTVKFLIENGANGDLEVTLNCDCCPHHCKKAIDIARYVGATEVVDYLQAEQRSREVAQQLLEELCVEQQNQQSASNKNKHKKIDSKKKKTKKSTRSDIPNISESPVEEKPTEIVAACQDNVLCSIDMNRNATDFVRICDNKKGFKQSSIFLYKNENILKTGTYMYDPLNKNVLIPFTQAVDNVGSSLAKNYLINADYSQHVKEKENQPKDIFHNFSRKVEDYGHWGQTVVTDFKLQPHKKHYWQQQLGTENNIANFWFEVHVEILASIYSGNNYSAEKARQSGSTGKLKYIALTPTLNGIGEKMIVHRFFEQNKQ